VVPRAGHRNPTRGNSGVTTLFWASMLTMSVMVALLRIVGPCFRFLRGLWELDGLDILHAVYGPGTGAAVLEELTASGLPGWIHHVQASQITARTALGKVWLG